MGAIEPGRAQQHPRESDDVADAIAVYTADGFTAYEHDQIKVGSRVHNRSEQYLEAHRDGTATVVWVGRKAGSWEATCGRLNIEVLVRRDRDGSLTWWADYGTEVVTPAA